MAFVKFAVQISRDNRWIVDTLFEDEAKAKAQAQKLVKDPKNDGVRIQREKRRADGSYDEEVVFESLKKGDKKKDYSLVEITAAPLCETLSELYAQPSRQTIGRLFTRYLDDVVLTPTELLCSYRELKRLMDMDIVQTAVDKVSTLQANATGTDGRARRDALFGLLDQALARARKASEKTDLPQVKSLGFAEAVKRIDASAPEAERDFLAHVALSRDLADKRSWTGKIEMVLGEMDKATSDRPLALLDAMLADLLGARGVLGEMFGNVPHLGAMLLRIMDLSLGRLAIPAGGRPSPDLLAAINQRLGSGRMPESRAELEGQFQRQVKSTQPLVKSEPTAEIEAFRQIIGRVVTADEIYGGSIVAEALTLRYSRFLPQGGAVGRREAITVVTSYLPTAIQQVRFLIALADTELGREQMNFTITTLETLIGRAQRMEDIVGLQGTPKTRMLEITQIYGFLKETTLLPSRVTAPLAEKLDSLVADFLVNNQILEKLDNPADSLRVRAQRLVQFCTSGVLPEGRAFTMGRDRVLLLLRQPKFDEKFVADLPDPAAREKALREFHRILATSNFLGDRK
ncbi:MAG: hypothetical protein ABT940_10105 [Alphaproteobacteria bacterium]